MFSWDAFGTTRKKKYRIWDPRCVRNPALLSLPTLQPAVVPVIKLHALPDCFSNAENRDGKDGAKSIGRSPAEGTFDRNSPGS